MPKPKIYVIHENDAWVEPLRAAFSEIDAPFEEWFISEGLLDLSEAPPVGIFYNRMSASSHTRDHRFAAELTGGVLAWLESHGRKIVNNGRALQLEISKIAQYRALADFGIRTPRTIAAVGRDQILNAAQRMNGPFITKHNRAGKGLGVKLFQSVDALREHLATPAFEPLRRRHHADPGIHPGARTVHHAGRVRGRHFPVRGACRHLAGLRALPRRCMPGRRCILPWRA